MKIPFSKDHRQNYGELEKIGPDLRRILANNPSPYTYTGTNTYVVGSGSVAVIDPGPNDVEHCNALLTSLGDETVSHIVVTHSHPDHVAGCERLQQLTGAQVYAMSLPELNMETHDHTDEAPHLNFSPDVCLTDGEIIASEGWQLECVHTPGHLSDHLCLALLGQDQLLSGDHVMAWSTSIVSPPHGHMGSYMKSLKRLLDRTEHTYWPGHGGPVTNPQQFVTALIQHRRDRETLIMECVTKGFNTVETMLPKVYADINQTLLPAAARSLFATVIYLVESGQLVVSEQLSFDSILYVN
ncbi:MAG: MBL fold metallo-hydrolase [Gammaproteobacteria bacterium]|nr:MBL fold metallo-hydrolase [Gammaproteobacteria bacterium]